MQNNTPMALLYIDDDEEAFFFLPNIAKVDNRDVNGNKRRRNKHINERYTKKKKKVISRKKIFARQS